MRIKQFIFIFLLSVLALRPSLLYGIDVEFVSIAPGEFTMGREDNAVEVSLTKSFDIGKYEVTQCQWHEVTGENPSHFKEKNHCPEEGEHQVKDGIPMCCNHPVENVSWNDIVDRFLPTLNTREGLIDCEGGYDNPPGCLRLPTEAEWEYIARAESKTRFFWGDSGDHEVIDEYAWWHANSYSSVSETRQTHRVGSKRPNRWGIHDTSGNVWEWTQDSWARDNHGLIPGENPLRTIGEYRVIKGGSQRVSNMSYLQSSRRFTNTPDGLGSSTGFRLARAR